MAKIRPSRTCCVCKKPMRAGMTDECGIYLHEGKCFESFMNKAYGEGKWYVVPDGCTDGAGGYYKALEDDDKWYGTGFYYTEWED